MANNISPVVECIACGWQGREHETDTRYCPECGGECMELDAIYGPNGLFADTDTVGYSQQVTK